MEAYQECLVASLRRQTPSHSVLRPCASAPLDRSAGSSLAVGSLAHASVGLLVLRPNIRQAKQPLCRLGTVSAVVNLVSSPIPAAAF